MKLGYKSIPDKPDNSIEEIYNEEAKLRPSLDLISPKKKVLLTFFVCGSILAFGYYLIIYNKHLLIKKDENSKDGCSFYYYKTKGNEKIDLSFIQSSIKHPDEFWKEFKCHPIVIRDEPDIKNSHTNRKGNSSQEEGTAVISVDWDGGISQKLNFGSILGFGGAFTEASSENFKLLSKKGQESVLQLLFGKSGLGYAMGRVPINSCDFSLSNYNFDNVDGDFDLEKFDLNATHDVENGMINMIIRANEIFKSCWSSNMDDMEGLKLIASPWSPPRWMKDPVAGVDSNNASHASTMDQSNFPIGLKNGTGIHSKYARSWALYFSKFLDAYLTYNITFWAVTVQNEPTNRAPWEACAYTKEAEASFVFHHLGPILNQNHPNTKILAYDFNKDNAEKWVNYLLKGRASAFIDGIAYHWYGKSLDRLLDGSIGAPNFHKVKEIMMKLSKKETLLLGTEACNCPSTGFHENDDLLLFQRAERYVHSILADLASGSQGWMEWNLLLNTFGGPNHLQNQCDSTLLAISDTTTISYKMKYNFPYPKEFMDVNVVVQPMYYYMGHITRYIRPHSVALMAIVDANEDDLSKRTFRKSKYAAPGGGMNLNVREGIEITTWPCEGSTRQFWNFVNGKLFVTGFDLHQVQTDFCVANHVDTAYNSVRLTLCESDEAARFNMVQYDATSHQVRLQILDTNICLTSSYLANSGGSYGGRGGVPLQYSPCVDSEYWYFDHRIGEMIMRSERKESDKKLTYYENCMTTGHPFLQAGFFDTSATTSSFNKVLVVLNEANDDAKFLVQSGFGKPNRERLPLLKSIIPAHSIQTYIL